MLKEKALKDVDNLPQYFASAESASQMVQLAGFHKFKNSAEALAAAVALNEGKACKPLRSVLKKVMKTEVQKKLLVLDAKLGTSIKDKLPELEIVSNSSVMELIRCIRGQMESLIPGISEKEASAMMLGLGHNLARYKLKFSPDKVDTMVVQAVNLLDDLDKELNNYVMRVKEWYGWHFPELSKILVENTAYVHTIKLMGMRTNASTTDFSGILDEEQAELVKEAAEVSMGCQINDEDILYMRELCDQILDLTSYRSHLSDYLTRRMTCLAPNLTIMLGELIGARLIAHSGSLINLAKNASSTLQLIGAEKALFRALKTKKATPKYGLIYHAEMVNRAPADCKGKMSRMLAAKASLAARVDALSEETSTKIGEDSRVALIKKVNFLSAGKSHQLSGRSKHQAKSKPHFSDRCVRVSSGAESIYPVSQDTTISAVKRERTDDEVEQPAAKKPKTEKLEPEEGGGEKEKKKKKKVKSEPVESVVTEEAVALHDVSVEKKKKKKKKKCKEEDEQE
ncbi:hypothetical protein HAZT_HAZT008735 [Hyalella azteca]|uniref:Nop domain-containing protein n=1 Tax=Hyalella azteca TaxID=294128 RepID=A0A6A0H0Q3_HYAAZ|nr:hypothetical protein HAZT_HAZT008735 [Hyalella azteca]